MIAAATMSFLGFALPRKRSQDFGWGFASCGSGNNLGNRGFGQEIGRIKPMADVISSAHPLKVLRDVVNEPASKLPRAVENIGFNQLDTRR